MKFARKLIISIVLIAIFATVLPLSGAASANEVIYISANRRDVPTFHERPSATNKRHESHGQSTAINIIHTNNDFNNVRHGSTASHVSFDMITVDSVSSRNILVNSSTPTLSRQATHSSLPLGQQIADFAESFNGYRYVWGGASPAGFDCSGLVTYVMRNFDITVTRTASGQFRDNGVRVTAEELEPGDLVFFSSNGRRVTHVGIYLGGDRYVHASGRRVGVIISRLSARPLFGASRLVDVDVDVDVEY